MIGGWVGWPESLGGSDRFSQFLAPVMAKQSAEGAEGAGAAHAASGSSTEYLLMLLSVAIAAAGIWLAYKWYIKQPEVPGRIAANFSGLYRVLYNKYYVDQIYDALFVNRVKDLALTLGAFDTGIINGLEWMARDG